MIERRILYLRIDKDREIKIERWYRDKDREMDIISKEK